MKQKARLYLRMDLETKQLAVRASAMTDTGSLSEFVAQAIREKAAQTIKETEGMRLSDHDLEAFVDACRAESLPNSALITAQKRFRARIREGAITYAGRGDSSHL